MLLETDFDSSDSDSLLLLLESDFDSSDSDSLLHSLDPKLLLIKIV
jgi:hypothetical protein